MEIIDDLADWSGEKQVYTGIVLGNFDGIHLGHQSLIKAMLDDVHVHHGRSAVVTFNPHPLEVLTGKPPFFIYTLNEKKALLEKMGVDYLIMIPFDVAVAQMDAADFIQQILLDTIGANSITVGFNYNFGNKASGDTDFLQSYCSKQHCQVQVVPAVTIDNLVVSSSNIRKFLADGNIAMVNKMLGYWYHISGPVITGNRLGRTLGFPTANLSLPVLLQIPAYGVYVVKVQVQGKIYAGVANVGIRPTLRQDNHKCAVVEVNIFDYPGQDIYHQTIEVFFGARIRGEIGFNDLQELSAQIESDCWTAQEFFRNNNTENYLINGKALD